MRKILVIVASSAGNGGSVVPGGILVMTVDRSRVRTTIIEATNQYVGGYLTESGSPPEITIRSPRDLPPLKVTGLM